MKNIEIANTIANAGTTFARFTYTSKATGEKARHTIILGGKYINIVEKSILELELLISENTFSGIELEAANAKLSSLKESLVAHQNGKQNSAYTKKGLYSPIGNGVNINTNDNTFQVFGISVLKKVEVAGVYKKVNSSPLTIAKRKIEKMLPIGNFREYALDAGNFHEVKVNGDTIEMVDAYDFEPVTEENVVVA